MFSGTLLFGVQLQVLRISHKIKIQIWSLKAYDKLLTKTKNVRAQNLANHTRLAFKDLSNCCYNSKDKIVLKSITFDV